MARTQREQTGVDVDNDLTPLVPEPAAAPPDRPDWLIPKFKTVEDQARAYAESERELHQTKDHAARLQEQIETFAESAYEPQQQQQPPGYGYDPAADPMLNAIAQANEAGDYHQAAILQAALNAQLVNAAFDQRFAQQQPDSKMQEAQDRILTLLTEQQVAARYGDEWQDLKEGVADYIQQHKLVYPETNDPVIAANFLSTVADLVRVQRMQNESRETTAAQAAQTRQQKLLAQTLTGGGPRIVEGATPRDELMEQMKRVRSYGYSAGG